MAKDKQHWTRAGIPGFLRVFYGLFGLLALAVSVRLFLEHGFVQGESYLALAFGVLLFFLAIFGSKRHLQSL